MSPPLPHPNPFYSSQGKDDANWGPNNKFRFPMRNGTGAIWQGLFEAIEPNRFRFNVSVSEINAEAKQIILSDGKMARMRRWITSSSATISTSTACGNMWY